MIDKWGLQAERDGGEVEAHSWGGKQSTRENRRCEH